MLTIVGYSINATIVIFDRIRENLHGGSREETGRDRKYKYHSDTYKKYLYFFHNFHYGSCSLRYGSFFYP